MNPRYCLTVPIPPSNNHRTRNAVARRRDGTAYTKQINTDEVNAYKLQVKTLANRIFKKPLDGELEVWFGVYRPRRSGDWDNYPKVLQDALNGIAWHDDSQITAAHVFLFVDKNNPKITLEVEQQ